MSEVPEVPYEPLDKAEPLDKGTNAPEYTKVGLIKKVADLTHRLPRRSAATLRDLERLRNKFPKYREAIQKLKMDPDELNFFKMADGKLRSSDSDTTHRFDTEQFLHDLQTPLDIPVNDGEEDQIIRMLLLNSDELLDPKDGIRKPLTVFFPGITGEVDKNLVHLQSEQLALEIDGPVVVFDIPPFGGSGKFTAKQIEELKKGGGFSEIAKAHLRALKILLEEAHALDAEVNLTGYSLGAYITAETAAAAKEFGIKVRNVISLETPGVEEADAKTLTERFIGEGFMNDALTSIPHNIDVRKAQDLAYPFPVTKAKQALWLLRNVWNSAKMTRSLGSVIVPQRIGKAMQDGQDTQMLISTGTKSVIATPEGIDDMFDYFDSTLPEDVNQRIHRKSIEGGPHSLFQNPQRVAKEIREGLDFLEGARAARHASGPRSDTV